MTQEHGYNYEVSNDKDDNDESSDDDERDDDDDSSDESGSEVDNKAWRDQYFCDICKHSTLSFNGIIYHRSIKHGKATRLEDKQKFLRYAISVVIFKYVIIWSLLSLKLLKR